MAEDFPGTNPINEQLEQRSALGAALSFEFDCSFAAAEASKVAHELLENRRKRDEARAEASGHAPSTEDLHIIGYSSGVNKTNVVELECPPALADQPVRLALLEPIMTIKKTEKEGVFSRILGRHVKTEYAEERGRPVLAAIFGDVALPLAAFERRKDGSCSYIQIGSEIKDDNFHVTAKDDKIGRHTVIEAIRDALSKVYSPLKHSTERTTGDESALGKLLDIELRQNAEQVGEAFDAQLVRYCGVEVNPDNLRRLIVLDDNGEGYERKFHLRTIISKQDFSDYSLVAGRPFESSDQNIAQLFAVSRGMLALPLGRLDYSTGQLTFNSSILSRDNQDRKNIVRQLSSLLYEDKNVDHFLKEYVRLGGSDPKKDFYGLDKADMKDREKILAWLQGRPSKANQYASLITNRLVDAGLQRLVKEDQLRDELFAQFDVGSRLVEIYGETNKEEERFIDKVHNMEFDSKLHRGVVENVKINNTFANAVFQVEITRDGSTYTVIVSGKPEAMEDEPLKVLSPFCVSFDTTRPLDPQLNGTKGHLKELLEVFDALKPLKSW